MMLPASVVPASTTTTNTPPTIAAVAHHRHHHHAVTPAQAAGSCSALSSSSSAQQAAAAGGDVDLYIVQKCWFSGPNYEPPQDAFMLFQSKDQAEKYAAKAAYEHAADYQMRNRSSNSKPVRTLLLPSSSQQQQQSCFAFCSYGKLFWVRQVKAAVQRYWRLHAGGGATGAGTTMQQQGDKDKEAHAWCLVSHGVIGGTGNPRSPRGRESVEGCVYIPRPSPLLMGAISAAETNELEADEVCDAMSYFQQHNNADSSNGHNIQRVPIIAVVDDASSTPMDDIGTNTTVHTSSSNQQQQQHDILRYHHDNNNRKRGVTTAWWNIASTTSQQQQQHQQQQHITGNNNHAMDMMDDDDLNGDCALGSMGAAASSTASSNKRQCTTGTGGVN